MLRPMMSAPIPLLHAAAMDSFTLGAADAVPDSLHPLRRARPGGV